MSPHIDAGECDILFLVTIYSQSNSEYGWCLKQFLATFTKQKYWPENTTCANVRWTPILLPLPKQVMLLSVFVCLFVCLSVSLSACQSVSRITFKLMNGYLHEAVTKGVSPDKEQSINFGDDTDYDPDLGSRITIRIAGQNNDSFIWMKTVHF